MNLGENIYRFRTEKNLSQGDLADALNVSRQSVSKWENNSAVPELDKLVKLSSLFGITLDELVNGEKEINTMPAKKMDIRMIAGLAIIAFGGFTWLAFAGRTSGKIAAFYALPFLLGGILMLLCKKHPFQCVPRFVVL